MNKDLKNLKPSFRTRFKLAMEEYNSKFKDQIFVVETTRTLEQQKEYVRTGKSKTLNSNHLIGKAVDIAFKTPSLYPTDDNIWLNLTTIMNKYGIVNGYFDLKWGFDKPHFQSVELQKPVRLNNAYTYAQNWRVHLKKEHDKIEDMIKLLKNQQSISRLTQKMHLLSLVLKMED